VTDRARVGVADVIMATAVSVTAVAVAPSYYEVIGMVRPHAGPLSGLLLDLVVPFVFIGVVLSVGVSAQRRY